MAETEKERRLELDYCVAHLEKTSVARCAATPNSAPPLAVALDVAVLCEKLFESVSVPCVDFPQLSFSGSLLPP